MSIGKQGVEKAVGGGTMRFFYPPVYTDSGSQGVQSYDGSHPITKLADAATKMCFFEFQIPGDVTSINSIKILWNCLAATGNMRYDALLQAAAAGEDDPSEHTNNLIAQIAATTGVSDMMLTTLALLTNLLPGDFCGLKITRWGGHVDDTLEQDVFIFGLEVIYT